MPTDRGPRRPIDGYDDRYEDNKGISAIARAGGRRKEKRFKLGTAHGKIDAWLDQTREKLRAGAKARKKASGTLLGDIADRLLEIPEGTARTNARCELAAWLPRFGKMARPDITTTLLKRQIAEWIAAEVPPSTINHRRRALAQLWDSFDGEDAPNPVRRTKRVREILGEPTSWDMDALDAMVIGMTPDRGVREKGDRLSKVHAMPHRNKGQGRLGVLLWTGIPPAGLMQLEPRRVAAELEKGEFTYPAREKGNGAPAVRLPLHPRAIEAVRRWLRARAWGSFSHGSLLKALRAAAKRYARLETAGGRVSPVPHETVTLRDLRDSFLTWLLLETGGDLYTVQLYGQHLDLETTKRYVRKAIPDQARRAMAKISQNADKRWPGTVAPHLQKQA